MAQNGTRTVLGMMQAVHELANFAQFGVDAEQQAKDIISQMDVNHDEVVTVDEFIDACLKDEQLSNMLSIPLM
jgi:hypothetical protein